ncbi:MAG TPA: type IV secretory system conjugative DNA transfer family protein [Acidimicrobiales bacterium]|nr:type IV secretory system conjugative DNA transfer family protein [Acidimicrobiales bacterium]
MARRPRPTGLVPDVVVGLGFAFVLAMAELPRGWADVHAHGHALAVAAAGLLCLLCIVGVPGLAARLGGDGRRHRARGASSVSGKARKPRRPRPEAGWAIRADLRGLEVKSPPGDRVVLGAQGRRLLAAEANQSVLVVGPTQSGKTSGLAIPAILEWDGPVVATSVKTDLVRETMQARARHGLVQLYDPTGATGMAAAAWSPLSTAGTWPGAKRLASALCSVARADGGMEDAGFWYSSAEKLLAPLLLAAASAGAEMGDVVRWIDDEELHEPLLALELVGVPDALRAARTSFGREERQRSSIFATAETIVAGFADPAVAASCHGPGVDPVALVDGGRRTLYCCAPAREQERLRPVFVALLRQVVDAAFARSGRLGRPLAPPLLVVLDEAANIAPLADLDTIVSTAAGHGIGLLTVWQDFAQIEARYGRRWPTIVNNHRAKVLCPGCADPLTLEHVSTLIGDDERADRSTTVGDDGRWSSTETASLRRVAPTSVLRRLSGGEAVVIYGALPPARVQLRR